MNEFIRLSSAISTNKETHCRTISAWVRN